MTSPFDRNPFTVSAPDVKVEKKYTDDDGIVYTLVNITANGDLRVRRDVDDAMFTFDSTDLDEV